MAELLSRLLAGLGLYFFGVSGLRSNLQQIPGRKFRDFIGKATAHPLLAAGSGFFMGTITQTSIGCTVILAGLIARGMATVQQALPVVAWTNLGLVTLVFLNNLPVPMVAMVLIGLCGVCLNFGLGGRFKGLMAPFFSLGLILFALRLMKESMHGLALTPGFMESLSIPHPFGNFTALLLGVLLRIPIQSSSAVVVIGITLEEAGIFSRDQAMMMLFGTALGSGASVFLLTAHFKGVMRQLTLFEAIINTAAGGLMLILFSFEHFTKIPFLMRGIEHIDPDIADEMALAFLLQQSFCILFAYLLLPKATPLLEKLAPTTTEQDISRPRFIHDQATHDAETALTLSEQELTALLVRTPTYLDPLRQERPQECAPPPAILHNAAQAIFTEINALLQALTARQRQSPETSIHLLQVQRRVNLLIEIEDAIFRLAQELEQLTLRSKQHPVDSFTHNIVESLDLLLTTSICAITSQKEDAQILLGLTSAPGEVIEDLRTRYLHHTPGLDHPQRTSILAITTQYERVMLHLNQLSRILVATPL